MTEAIDDVDDDEDGDDGDIMNDDGGGDSDEMLGPTDAEGDDGKKAAVVVVVVTSAAVGEQARLEFEVLKGSVSSLLLSRKLLDEKKPGFCFKVHQTTTTKMV